MCLTPFFFSPYYLFDHQLKTSELKLNLLLYQRNVIPSVCFTRKKDANKIHKWI